MGGRLYFSWGRARFGELWAFRIQQHLLSCLDEHIRAEKFAFEDRRAYGTSYPSDVHQQSNFSVCPPPRGDNAQKACCDPNPQAARAPSAAL
jgi:hypothetical protein